MKKVLILMLLVCLFGMARGQTSVVYWFDSQKGPAQTIPMSDGSFEIDASQLPDGLHSLHVQCLMSDGSCSFSEIRYFLRVSQPESIGQYTVLCSIDGKMHSQETMTGGTFEIDASQLPDGLHALNVQCLMPDGICTFSEMRYFLRVSPQENIDQLNVYCSVDGVFHNKQTVAIDAGLASFETDLSDISEGLHHITLQAITPSGEMTDSYNGFFLRNVVQTSETLNCSYTIDNNKESVGMGIISHDGSTHFDLDVASLSDGLHCFTYLLHGDKGGNSLQTCYFMKIPVGGDKITKYQYWVNDNSTLVHTTTLAEPKDPLQVVSLLPVESHPLRSSLFHFEISDNQPMMYAKNTLHARFYDLTDHFAEATDNFIDYSASAPVTPVGELQSGVRETTERPAANVVTWYTLTAQRGDSLRLKIDCPATIQLFAPSGDEIYNASGLTSTKWGGCHAEESGTFYMALHDVTSTKGTDVSIDYECIDKYAVLWQDVTTVGNGGPSTITFMGNGFDELTSVDLIKDAETISSIEVKNNGKAETAVKFDFNGAEVGQYKAVFHFTDGNVTVEECVTVEDALAVSYSATVSYASKFLLSTGNKYVYKVKNHGNMSAYNVPMTITVYTTDATSLETVSITGCSVTGFTENSESADIEGHPYLRRYTISQTLRPSATENFTVHVKTKQRVYVYLQADGIARTGGPSDPVSSLDPNDIYGYQDEKGDKTIRGGLTDVYYTIEFENDPEFATASAHDIYVTDVLSPELFNLSTFAPTRVKIGNKEIELNGEKNGVVTFEMYPEINAIAQLEWSIDETTGIARWHVSSLDPMSLEATDDVTQGVLPVNYDGSGLGQLSFDISLKVNLPDGTEIPNMATIVFDANEPIETPTWTNVIEDILIGDVNDDGVVDTQDAIKVIQYYLKKNPENFDKRAADVNGDGVVDTQDAIKIIKIYLKKE